MTASAAIPDAGYGPLDDLRHRPEVGKRMRDSLFYEIIMPEEQLGLQIYLYLTGTGRTGYNVSVWGPGAEPVALVLHSGRVPDEMDFDHFEFDGLHIEQPELLQSATVSFHHRDVQLEYNFRAVHQAFSYRSNPDGLPSWFADNRMEQTGRVTGHLEVAGRRIEWDRPGHRDHSWGVRDWGIPQHWKWFVAYTDSGRVVNGWIWIAKGEWGFAGYVARDGVTVAISRIDHKAEYHDDMRQRRLTATVHDVEGGVTHLVMDAFGVIKLPTNDSMATEIWEAACTATIDGEAGAGQFETHWSAPYLQHVIASGR
jgi:hypothetical protein